MSDKYNHGRNPLRPQGDTALFAMEEVTVRIKKSTALERERALDGTPLTRMGRTGLSPKQPDLIVKGNNFNDQAPEVAEEEESTLSDDFAKAQVVIKSYMES